MKKVMPLFCLALISECSFTMEPYHRSRVDIIPQDDTVEVIVARSTGCFSKSHQIKYCKVFYFDLWEKGIDMQCSLAVQKVKDVSALPVSYELSSKPLSDEKAQISYKFGRKDLLWDASLQEITKEVAYGKPVVITSNLLGAACALIIVLCPDN